MYCWMPPLAAVPDAIVWICPSCEAGGVLVQPILEQRIAADAAEPRFNQALMFPNAQQREADSRAALLDGRSVLFKRGGSWVRGSVQFVQRTFRPAAFSRRPPRLQGMTGGPAK
jgi:hypothetical protein